MAKKPQKRLVTPKVYEIGEDISQEKINLLTAKLADWFVESRPAVKEPGVLARQKIRDCLAGVTSDGKPWFAAANSTFETRIKIVCRFDCTDPDSTKWDGIRSADEATRARKQREKQRLLERKKRDQEDQLIPDEIRKELTKSVRYGDDPSVFLSTAEHERWNELRDGFQRQHPELKLIAAEAELNKLCNLLIVDERQQMKMLKGEKGVDFIDMKNLTDQIVSLKKSLGIHADQLAKKKDEKGGSSIAEAVARYEALPEDLRRQLLAEELIEVFQMYHSPSPRSDSGGYQLDEFGLFSLTRTRLVTCPHCGEINYAGFSMKEIEEYLAREGYVDFEDPEPEKDEKAEVTEEV